MLNFRLFGFTPPRAKLRFLMRALCLYMYATPALADAPLPPGSFCRFGSPSPSGEPAIVCQDLAQKNLSFLNSLLDREYSDTDSGKPDLQQKLAKANAWVKRYRDLKIFLDTQATDEPLARQAAASLANGNLAEAGDFLDRLLAQQQQLLVTLGRFHFNRARLYELLTEPEHALAHYAPAYRYQPDNVEYADAYADALQNQNQLPEAIRLHEENLAQLKQLSAQDPERYAPTVEHTLAGLAGNYTDAQQLQKAEAALRELLERQQHLAARDPENYRAKAALTFGKLGRLYQDTKRPREGKTAYRNFLDAYRLLSARERTLHQSELAETLHNSADFYKETGNDPEPYYQEAITLYRKLADTRPEVYHPKLAAGLSKQALYRQSARRFKAAEADYRDALEIYRDLAASNPETYQPLIATTLNNLAILYRNRKGFSDAENAYRESLGIYEQLAARKPKAYQANIATTLTNLGTLYNYMERFDKAEAAYQKAISIARRLAESEPETYRQYLVRIAMMFMQFYLHREEWLMAKKQAHEAANIYRPLWRQQPEVYGDPLALTLLAGGRASFQAKDSPEEVCAWLREAAGAAYSKGVKVHIQNVAQGIDKCVGPG
ncbi:MAG: tetratricopeptide repeat protein [Gammaproteobacteria bacterium]|nr:tetratricopeptide repeat protein [Gammaproteobacteria bacterium]